MPDSTTTHHAATLAKLARPGDLRALRLPVLHVVISMRLCALFDQAGREPVGELSARFGSVTSALAVLDLARKIGCLWPEPYLANRPCCMRMSPDEMTLAALARAALGGDRAGFTRELDGFIRASRHEPLFNACLTAVATFS